MSFILDALKKSEIERQRQSVPGLMDTRFKERRTGLPVWAAALGVLLGVNLLVLAFVLWNKSAPAPHAAPPAESAVVSAAARPQAVGAVVSRGGRPDLAGPALARVRAPTLLIVGGNDFPVIELNRAALGQLRSEKRLVIVPAASHLFEEPGALDEVARLARDWFERRLVPVTRAPSKDAT